LAIDAPRDRALLFRTGGGVMRWGNAVVVPVLFAVAARAAWGGDLEDAADLRAKGRLDDAVAKYRAAAADGTSKAAALGLSETLLLLRRWDDAAAAVDAALKKDPADATLLLAKVRALVEGAEAEAKRPTPDGALRPETAAKVADARKCLTPVLAKDAKSVPARVLDARLVGLERGAESAEPRRRLELVLADASADGEANFRLALVLFQTAGRNNKDKALWASAEKCFRAAFAADPANGRALFDAAMCAAWQGRYDQQYLDDLERAALLLPDDEAPLMRVDTYYSKDATKRIPIYTRLLAKHPDDSAANYHMALALDAVGHGEDGQKLLDDLCTRQPKSPALRLNLAQFQLGAGRKDQFVENALRAVALCNGDAGRDVYDHLDLLLVRARKEALSPDERDKLWTALFAQYPHEVNAPNNAGLWFRDVAKEPARSLTWFVKALAIAPEDTMLLNDVGLAYEGLEKPDLAKAEESFRKAIAVARKNGVDRPDASQGYNLAVENLVNLLEKQKRAADMRAVAKELKDDPRVDSILSRADKLR
jgi:tetratricopeptide repeat protein